MDCVALCFIPIPVAKIYPVAPVKIIGARYLLREDFNTTITKPSGKFIQLVDHVNGGNSWLAEEVEVCTTRLAPAHNQRSVPDLQLKLLKGIF